MSEIPIIDWHGLYRERWGNLIVTESTSHPAKFSRGMIERLADYGIERGWWNKSSVVGDPFGGIATGGIVFGHRGIQWMGVELEPRFVSFARQNIDKYRWDGPSDVRPVIEQGDSRKFAEIVATFDGIEAVVTSPPFGIDQPCQSQSKSIKDYHKFTRGDGTKLDKQMKADGNIAELKQGSVDAIISSPPYVDRSNEPYKMGVGPPTRSTGLGADRMKGDYHHGDSPGQIARLEAGQVDSIVTSPPYAGSVTGDHAERETAQESHAARSNPGAGGSLGQSQRHGGYGVTTGQIGALVEGKLDAIATSPPFEDCGVNLGGVGATTGMRQQIGNSVPRKESYGGIDGQIGNDAGETYWAAMDAVYRQCMIALKPGGIMCVVLKDYVKNKAIVPLVDDSLRLLEHIGFIPIERIRCWIDETTEHNSLFGAPLVETKSRKSFFRKLAEAKGSPRIDFEEILVLRKPE